MKTGAVRPKGRVPVAVRFEDPGALRHWPRFRQRCLASTALSGLVLIGGMTGLSYANPTGGTVVGGAATISQPSSTVTNVTQTSQRAIINWNSFSINAGERTQFNQPNSSAWTLNRVTGGDPSLIANGGQLIANGNIAISNASGVVFAKGSQVDVNGLIVTTADINNQDFMAGRLNFSIPSSNPNATVTNAGQISVADHGLAALVAPGVANSGVIRAKFGKVMLAGAETFTVDFYGDGLISFDVGSKVAQAPVGPDGKPIAALVTNTGLIETDGGTVLLTADAADNILTDLVHAGGTLQAQSVGAQTGQVIVDGGSSANGTVLVSGAIDASGLNAGETGGSVSVRGDQVGVLSGASINVSGAAGGGNVAIGGTFHGADGHNATATVVQKGATITANAVTTGNGGNVAIWSQAYTSFNGTIYARGGINGGNGGYVETSSAGNLSVGSGAVVDLRSYSGTDGMWLLDPLNLTLVHGIDTSGTDDTSVDTGTGTVTLGFKDTPTNDTVSDGAINAGLATASVVLQAQNDITVNGTADTGGAVQITGTAGHDLTLEAGRSITVDAGASITLNGNFTAVANDSTDLNPSGGKGGDPGRADSSAGNFTMQALATVNVSSGTGSISISTGAAATNNADTKNSTIDFTPGSITLGRLVTGTGNLTVVDADGSVAASGGISQTADGLTVGGTSSFTTQTTGATINLATATNALTGAVTLDTTGNAGDASLKNGVVLTGTMLAASNVGGNLSIEETLGGISESGVLQVHGTSLFQTDAASRSITLNTQTNALKGAVTLNTTGNAANASLKNGVASTGTVLGASMVSGNLSIEEATAGISQTGVVQVTGTSSFQTDTTGQTIDLSTSTNVLGGGLQAISFSTTGSGNTVNLLNSGGTLFGASTIHGTLSVEDTTGGIGQIAALTVTGTSSFTTDTSGRTIGLQALNDFGNTVTLSTLGATGNASLTNTAELDITGTVGGLAFLDAPSISFDTFSAGSLSATASTGGISQTGAVQVTGVSLFQTNGAGQTIDLTTSTNALTGAVSLDTAGAGGDASLKNGVTTTGTVLGVSAVGGNLSVEETKAGISQTGAVQVTGTSHFQTDTSGKTINLATSTNALTGAVTLSTTGAGANASLKNGVAPTGTVLGGSTVGGNLSIEETLAGISQTAALQVTGTSRFQTDTLGQSIALNTQTNALKGAVSLDTNGAGANASLKNGVASTGTVLGASIVGGNLSIEETKVGISQTGVVQVTGTSSFQTDTAGQTIDLSTSTNVLGGGLQAITFVTTGAGNTVNLKNSAGTLLGAMSITGTLSVEDTTGSISQTGALAVTGLSSFKTDTAGQTISLTGANDLGNTVTLTTSGAAGNASLTNTAVLDVTGTVGGQATFTAPSISLGTLSVGSLTATASTGGISQTGAIQATGTSIFVTQAASQPITLTNNGNAFAGFVAFETVNGNVAVVDSVPLNVPLGTVGTGTLSLTAPGVTIDLFGITSDTSTTIQAFGNGTAWAVGAADGFAPNGTPVLVSDASLGFITGGGALTIASNSGADLYVNMNTPANLPAPGFGNFTLTADHNLNIDSNLAAGSTGNLILNATTGAIVQNAGAVTATNLTATSSSAGGSITLASGTNDITGLVTLTATGNASYSAGVDTTVTSVAVGGALTINDAGHTLTLPGVSTGGAQTYTAATVKLQGASYVTNGTAFKVTGDTVLSNPLTTIDTTKGGVSPLGANVTFANGSGSGRIDGTTVGAQALTINAGTNGTIEIGGYVGSSVALGAMTLTDSLLKLDVDVTAGLNEELVLTNSGTFSQTGDTQLVGNGNFDVFVIDTTNSNTSPAGANVTFGGRVNATQAGLEDLVVEAGSGTATFNGQVGNTGPLAVLETVAGLTDLNGGSITTTSSQVYDSPVMLSTANTLTSTGGGTIVFVGPVNGAFGLTLSTGGEDLFEAAVGAAHPLTGLMATGVVVGFGGPVTIDGNLSVEATGGNITQTGPFTVSGTSSFTTDAPGAGIILTNAGNALSGEVNLQTAANGSASLTNDVPTTLVTASVGGTLTINSIGGDLTLAGDVVTVNASLTAHGAINQIGGIITATNLSGSSVGGASFENPNKVGTFGSFTNAGSGNLSFVDLGGFTAVGTLSSAGNLSLTGPNIVLAGNLGAGGTISVASSGPLAAIGSVEVDAPLVKLGGTSFIQTGTLASVAPVLEIEASPGITQANLGCDQCTVPADVLRFTNIGDPNSIGPITLQNLSMPQTNVLIWAGAGTLTGTINVKGLGIDSTGGSADLKGTIDGATGIAAADLAVKGPRADTDHRINDCPLATPDCIVLPQVVPVLPLPSNLVNLLQDAAPSDPLDIERLDTGSEDEL